ncbi:hypothetical protein OG900_33390 [Streptomyces sp. NBC_00433]
MAARIEEAQHDPPAPPKQEAPDPRSEQPKRQYQSAAALAAKYPDEIELVKAV